MTAAESFIYRFEGDQREILLYFHQWFTETLQLTVKMRYKIPFYDGRSWICYLNPTKDEKIELAFVRGNELSNAQGILSNKGRKQVFGVEFSKLSDIDEDALREVMHEALLLDETKPYTVKNK